MIALALLSGLALAPANCDSANPRIFPRVQIVSPELDTNGLGSLLAKKFALRDKDVLQASIEAPAPDQLQQLDGIIYKQKVSLLLGRPGEAPALTFHSTGLGDSRTASIRKALEAIKPSSEQLDTLHYTLTPCNR
jgi:hypothetical protein